jgi:hypothetical protein
MIKASMQSVLSMINNAAETLNASDPSISLATRVFEKLINDGQHDPTAETLKFLREEVRSLML